MSKHVHSKRAVWTTKIGLSGQIYLTQEIGKKSKLRPRASSAKCRPVLFVLASVIALSS